MRTFIKTLSLSLALAVAAPLVTGFSAAVAKDVAVKVDRKKMVDHLKTHQTYPATRAELLASCKDLVDFTDAEKKYFADHLPEGTYASADEVVKAVFKK